MEQRLDYSPEQLADELAVIVDQGVLLPLKGRTEADIPTLAAIARELAPNPSLPLTRLIAEVVRPAIRRLDPAQMAMAEELFDAQLDTPLDDPKLRVTRRLLDDDRRPRVAKIAGYTDGSWARRRRQYEGLLCAAVAAQVLALLAAHRAATAPAEPALSDATMPAEPQAPKPPRVAAATAPEPPGHRMLVGVIGVALVVAGIGWLVATASGAIG